MIVLAVAAAAFLALVALGESIARRTYVASPLATAAPTASVATPSPQVSLTPTAVPEATAAAVITAVLPVGDPLEAEIINAYKEYLRVYSEALYSLDASQVPTVADGEELQRINSRIDSLRQQSEAIFVNVEHMTHVVRVSGVDADIGLRDQFTDRSYAVNPSTKEPIAPSDGSEDTDVQLAKGVKEDVLFLFKKIDGSWKVVRSFRVAQ